MPNATLKQKVGGEQPERGTETMEMDSRTEEMPGCNGRPQTEHNQNEISYIHANPTSPIAFFLLSFTPSSVTAIFFPSSAGHGAYHPISTIFSSPSFAVVKKKLHNAHPTISSLSLRHTYRDTHRGSFNCLLSSSSIWKAMSPRLLEWDSEKRIFDTGL